MVGPTARATPRSIENTFTIIDNDLEDQIIGTFAGLADGATFDEVFDGVLYTFQISYTGGDGNDVDLMVTNMQQALQLVASTSLIASDGSGETVTHPAPTGQIP